MPSLQSTLLLAIAASLVILSRVGVVVAICTVAKHETGFGDRIQCSNASLSSVQLQNSSIVSAIMIFRSRIAEIPNEAFTKYSKSLESLNMNDCGITRIALNGFAGLSYLKKLGLPNNNLTEIKAGWFAGLLSLEQLDLSFNRIQRIDGGVFERVSRLRWLDISENQLTCITPQTLLPLSSFEKIRFQGNPLNFKCRGELSLWLRDHGVNYKSEPHGPESWLDDILWVCAVYNENATELDTKRCLLLNLFNQLRTALIAANPRADPQQCADQRNSLVNCVAEASRRENSLNSGTVVARLLLLLRSYGSVI